MKLSELELHTKALAELVAAAPTMLMLLDRLCRAGNAQERFEVSDEALPLVVRLMTYFEGLDDET